MELFSWGFAEFWGDRLAGAEAMEEWSCAMDVDRVHYPSAKDSKKYMVPKKFLV